MKTVSEVVRRLRKIAAERNQVMYEMREAGYTLQEIANEFEISRQRVHQIIKHHKEQM